MNSSTTHGLRPISKHLEGRDTESIRKWLERVGPSLPVITHERKEMSNQHIERPGFGVMYYEVEKKKEGWPDYKGYVILKNDYKAGDKLKLALWIKETRYPKPLFSLREDELHILRKAENQPDKEVQPAYVKHKRYDDDDVPF